MNTVLKRSYRAEFVKTVAATGTPERLTSRSVTSIARSGTTRRCLVTITGHGFTPGAVVYFSGAAEAEFNGTFNVASVIDDDTFYILIAGSTAAASGTLVCYADIWVRQATLLGKKGPRTNNAGNVYLGTKAADNLQPYELPPNAEMFLPAGREGVGPMINLADWYLDVANNDDGAYVLYF
jgi:hypothetical protein